MKEGLLKNSSACLFPLNGQKKGLPFFFLPAPWFCYTNIFSWAKGKHAEPSMKGEFPAPFRLLYFPKALLPKSKGSLFPDAESISWHFKKKTAASLFLFVSDSPTPKEDMINVLLAKNTHTILGKL